MLSNISYNSYDFLKKHLELLRKAKKIRWWCIIFHKKEDEELKDHFHIVIIPDQRLETSDLDDEFIEIVPDNLPLKCMIWTNTKSIYDWILYGIHDPIYLKLKYAEDKKRHYSFDDLESSDPDILSDFFYKAYHEFDFWKSEKYKKFLADGMSCKDMVKNGYVEFKDMTNFAYFTKIVNDGV